MVASGVRLAAFARGVQRVDLRFVRIVERLAKQSLKIVFCFTRDVCRIPLLFILKIKKNILNI